MGKITCPAWVYTLCLAAAAFSAGLLNGLLGTGGGVILVFVLSALMGPERGKEVFVISSFGILVFSLVSALTYGRGGSLDPAVLPRFVLPAAAGGVVGAFLMDKIRLFWLRKLFAALLLYSGLKLVGVL